MQWRRVWFKLAWWLLRRPPEINALFACNFSASFVQLWRLLSGVLRRNCLWLQPGWQLYGIWLVDSVKYFPSIGSRMVSISSKVLRFSHGKLENVLHCCGHWAWSITMTISHESFEMATEPAQTLSWWTQTFRDNFLPPSGLVDSLVLRCVYHNEMNFSAQCIPKKGYLWLQ